MWSKKNLIHFFISKHRLLVLATLVASFLSNFITVLIPISIGKYYDLVFGFHTHRSQILNWLPWNFGDHITGFLVLFIGLVLFKMLVDFCERYYTGMVGEKFVWEIRNQLFDHQLKLPLSIYDSKGSGKYLLRFSGDLRSIQNYLTKGVIRFISDCTLIVLTLGILFLFHYQLGLLLLALIIFPIISIILLNRPLIAITREKRNAKSGLLSFVSRSLRAINSIQAFNKEFTETKKYKKRSDKLYQKSIAYLKIQSLIRALIPGLLYIILGAV